jgi:hypothetical protein
MIAERSGLPYTSTIVKPNVTTRGQNGIEEEQVQGSTKK